VLIEEEMVPSPVFNIPCPEVRILPIKNEEHEYEEEKKEEEK